MGAEPGAGRTIEPEAALGEDSLAGLGLGDGLGLVVALLHQRNQADLQAHPVALEGCRGEGETRAGEGGEGGQGILARQARQGTCMREGKRRQGRKSI